jgi:hypothetical protein
MDEGYFETRLCHDAGTAAPRCGPGGWVICRRDISAPRSFRLLVPHNDKRRNRLDSTGKWISIHMDGLYGVSSDTSSSPTLLHLPTIKSNHQTIKRGWMSMLLIFRSVRSSGSIGLLGERTNAEAQIRTTTTDSLLLDRIGRRYGCYTWRSVVIDRFDRSLDRPLAYVPTR